MVNKVDYPQIDSIVIVSDTIDEKVHYRNFYNRLKSDLLARIQLYIDSQGDPSKIGSMSLRDYTDTNEEAEQRKKSLIGLYKPKCHQQPYTQLENLRNNNGLISCPSCGELGRPKTLDHYLPKDIFPEFSITLANLTPMCDWCQLEKGTDYISGGEKIYIHPYFDDIDKPLIQVIFSPPYNAPAIKIKAVEELPGEIEALLYRHIKGIDFDTRYKAYFKTAYMGVLRASEKCRQKSPDALRYTLEIILEMEMVKGINSWDTILYRSVLSDQNLMDYLETEILPENL